jgi:type VI secretion system protein ImpF
MRELLSKERLQPSLLDRLTDLEPDKQQESREARSLSEAQLREALRRDLAWLLNTTHLAALEDLRAYPEVARSVVNFGIPDLAGQTLSGVDEGKLERTIREAVLQFEPRLMRESLTLRALVEKDNPGHNTLVFDIEGEMWAEPVPRSLFLRTEINLEDGVASVQEVPAGGRR